MMTGQKGLKNDSIRLSYDFWLELNEKEKMLTDEGYRLLLEIDKTGSLLQAAGNTKISYRRARGLIGSIEKYFGFRLITRRKGDDVTRKNEITPEGMQLLNAWRALHYETEIAVKSISNIFLRRIKDIYADK
jgi:molybdate transport repressor ModE-like protein